MIRVLIPTLMALFNSFSGTDIKFFYQKMRTIAREKQVGLSPSVMGMNFIVPIGMLPKIL
jgi:hypothetical protein